jgi:predicted ATPase
MGPVHRLRFHGLRKLNWEARPQNSPYLQHLNEAGFEGWLDVGPLTILVGPNGGGKSTVIDLLRALRDAKVWPGLPRENYPGADFSGFDAEGSGWKLSARFSKYTPDAKDMFRLLSAHVVGARTAGDPVSRWRLTIGPSHHSPAHSLHIVWGSQ